LNHEAGLDGSMRLSADIGGTFTDLVVESADGEFCIFKAPTTPADPVLGVFAAIDLAAQAFASSRKALLSDTSMFIHATTRSTNAILTNSVARTAFLTTEGHPDILLFREGGRIEPFNYTVSYPDPLVPRSLTFEVPERIGHSGEVIKPLLEAAFLPIIDELRRKQVEAIGVCLLWSMLNPSHELAVGDLLRRHLPGIPFSLSHQLNPTIREYRRASSTCMDASLKPLMTRYLGNLETQLAAAGFRGRLLTVTSFGSAIDAADMAAAPIHSVKSGPSMAPIGGRYYASLDAGADIAIVADTGGTSYDVTLVRRGAIPRTQETWLGERFRGHMTGFPSVDVKSIGAGGGSIAWVDVGGMLHVGPRSAGSEPGPVCYEKGGHEPTVTDAALVLGYIDPDYFLGGAIRLNVDAATATIEKRIGGPLGLDRYAAADAILELASETMVHAIEEITVNQGIDPAAAVLIGGGGAAGINAVRIARRLNARKVIVPAIGATLSAASALMSDLSTEYSATRFTTSGEFDFPSVNRALADLEGRCRAFVNSSGSGILQSSIQFFADARYPHQIWEVEVPLSKPRFDGAGDVHALVEGLHRAHEKLFSFRDAGSAIEIVSWRARVSCRLPRPECIRVAPAGRAGFRERARRAYFPQVGMVDTAVRHIEDLSPGNAAVGPAIIESSFTTIVVDPGAAAKRTASGSIFISLDGGQGAATECVT
jgi:N-methylhydantoinase A